MWRKKSRRKSQEKKTDGRCGQGRWAGWWWWWWWLAWLAMAKDGECVRVRVRACVCCVSFGEGCKEKKKFILPSSRWEEEVLGERLGGEGGRQGKGEGCALSSLCPLEFFGGKGGRAWFMVHGDRGLMGCRARSWFLVNVDIRIYYHCCSLADRKRGSKAHQSGYTMRILYLFDVNRQRVERVWLCFALLARSSLRLLS